MISQRARYAFKAVVALARAKPGEGLQIRQLCEQEKLPRKFLEQILLTLKAAGYITSRRGRDGGYELLKPASKILIGPMLRSVDGPIAPLPCLSAPLTAAATTAGTKRPASSASPSTRPTVTISPPWSTCRWPTSCGRPMSRPGTRCWKKALPQPNPEFFS